MTPTRSQLEHRVQITVRSFGVGVAAGVSKAGTDVVQPKARARWGDIKKSVDLIKMMKGKESAQAGKVRMI